MESVSLKGTTMIALALLGCIGCGPQQLEGSLSVLIDLKYQRVLASGSADEATVKFTRPQGSGEDLVLQVTAQRIGLDASALQFDLAETISPGVQRGAISRNVLDDPRRTFPTMLRGRLQFNHWASVGQTVNGNFSVTFAEGTTFASGRTVYGNFGATVQ